MEGAVAGPERLGRVDRQRGDHLPLEQIEGGLRPFDALIAHTLLDPPQEILGSAHADVCGDQQLFELLPELVVQAGASEQGRYVAEPGATGLRGRTVRLLFDSAPQKTQHQNTFGASAMAWRWRDGPDPTSARPRRLKRTAADQSGRQRRLPQSPTSAVSNRGLLANTWRVRRATGDRLVEVHVAVADLDVEATAGAAADPGLVVDGSALPSEVGEG